MRPGRSIIRWSSPVAYFKRVVAEDTEIPGQPILVSLGKLPVRLKAT